MSKRDLVCLPFKLEKNLYLKFNLNSTELEGSTDDGEDNDDVDAIDEPNSVWLTDANGETVADSDREVVAQPVRSKRSKRQADQYEYTPTKTRCPLLLVADYRFFQEMGGGNTKTTINYLVRILTYSIIHVYPIFLAFPISYYFLPIFLSGKISKLLYQILELRLANICYSF